MEQQAYAVVGLTHQHVGRCETKVLDALLVQFGCDSNQVTDGGIHKITLRYDGRTVVEQLLDSDVIAQLNSNGIDTVVALVRREAQLVFVLDLCQCLALLGNTRIERNIVGQLVVEFHKVTVFAVYQPLVEVAVRQAQLIGFAHITCLYQFFVIHRFFEISVQKYTIKLKKEHELKKKLYLCTVFN